VSHQGKILVIGLGGVSRCTLPLLFGELSVDPSQYTVIDFGEVAADDVRFLRDKGATFETERVTPENYRAVLSERLGPGDLIIDLGWNIDTLTILDWCRAQGVRFINASLEVWDPYEGIGSSPPRERTLYARHMALRKLIDGWGDNSGPTAVLDHGANPGLVSHFTKQALLDIADAWLAGDIAEPGPGRDAVAAAATQRDFASLAHALGVATIHISERDTQVSNQPKRENEFVNTWSVEGFHEEGIAPAELGWGTHERTLPPGAQTHLSGPLNQICISHPGCRTWVRSWVPCGEIVGMVIRHGEAFSISDRLTVRYDGQPIYRPTVHYAYCPADAAIASLHELHMRGDELQDSQRLMYDDIVEGRDELGCLLMGHPLKSWWIGSLLDIEETRRLAPGQNATTLQVAASLLAATKWMLENPSEGVLLPDDLPHEPVLEVAKPYLGPFVSQAVDWTPLDNWHDGFAGYGRPRPADEDLWQFSTFLVRGPS
jgi:homospermidine synthase